MSKFRKRPVIVEAEQFKGQECLPFAGRGDPCWYNPASHRWVVNTLEGALFISEGDWIIKGVKGEFYPCKPDVFEQTYEPVMRGYHGVEEFYKHDPNEKQETHGICAIGEELDAMRKRMESKTVMGPNEPPPAALTFTAPTQPKCPFWAHCDGERIIIRNAVACIPLKEYETLKAQQPSALAANNSIEFVAFIRSILDGTDKGTGKLADLRLESLRQDLLALVAKKERGRK